MKKVLLVLVLSLYLIAEVEAQQGFAIGADVGGNSTWIVHQHSYGDSEMEYQATYGYTLGLVTGYNFNELFGFRVGIRYSDQGQNYKDLVYAIPTHRKADLKYFQVPVTVRYAGGRGNPKFFFELGSAFYFLQAASYSQNGGVTTHYLYDKQNVINGPASFTINDATYLYEHFDVALEFSVGAQIELGEMVYLNPGLRFNYGFTDINAEQFRREFFGRPYESISNNFFGGIMLRLSYITPTGKGRFSTN